MLYPLFHRMLMTAHKYHCHLSLSTSKDDLVTVSILCSLSLHVSMARPMGRDRESPTGKEKFVNCGFLFNTML